MINILERNSMKTTKNHVLSKNIKESCRHVFQQKSLNFSVHNI